ncbi:uncharacterized protein LOC115563403 [Drosophila navojoa]|uniref:uncharacterized protein LOC115563403 n=1 Tax=Drosophila navojoa TaxID=7232 RepID=UPI0011BE7B89|nr:uncharacterized protein LOC115563403 [Drosophila navojoa]
MYNLHIQSAVFYYTKGQRKSIKLNYGGHSYVKFMENSRGTKWICATRSTTKCRARVRTKGEILEVLHGPHNHQICRRHCERAKQRKTASQS